MTSNSWCRLLLVALPALAAHRGLSAEAPMPRAVLPQQTLVAPGGAAADTFGRRVAVSGDRLVVGANAEDRGTDADVGAAYVYLRTGSTWALEATLQPADVTAFTYFGWSVAIDGDTIVVGALGDDSGGLPNRGAAYVFVRGGSTWSQQAKLLMPNGQAGDEAGASVAVDGDTLAVGAPYHDVASSVDFGATWVFVRTGTSWTSQAEIDNPRVAGNPPINFGRSIALRHDTLVIGSAPETVFSSGGASSGAADVYLRQGTSWTQQASLQPSQSLCSSAHFGVSVALYQTTPQSSATAVVGAPGQCVSIGGAPAVAAGAAYVFTRTGTNWSQQAELAAQASQVGQRRGEGVAIDGDTAIVGAPGGAGDPGQQAGALTLYTRAGSTWTEGPTLQPTDAQAADHFGASVAMSPSLFFVGAPNDDVGATADQGSVRVLDYGNLDTDQDGLPDSWERQFGLDPLVATGVNGATGDPDGDGSTNLQEFQSGTHPRNVATLTRYLAEGASTVLFDTRIVVANPGGTAAAVLLRFLRTDGVIVTSYMQVPAMARRSLVVDSLPQMDGAEFSTIVETDTLVVVDRTMWWDSATAYGTHAETAVDGPDLTWYLAEGATHSGFSLFYLVQNPSPTTAADVRVTYLLPAPAAPVVKTYQVAPNSRFNIWVNREGPALAATDVSAVVSSTNNVPIIVERAMYLVAGGQMFGAGHESAGVRAPAASWYLAEGATGTYFDLFVLVANPGATDATVQATYLLPSGTTIVKVYTVEANSRFNIWVDREDPALADTAVSTLVTSTNGVPIIVERSMWWPGPTFATWQEAHNSAAARATAARWAMAEGEVGGPANVQTYILLANTGGAVGVVRVTLLFEGGGAPLSRDFAVPGNSRFNVDVRAEFAGVVDRQFGALVESQGGTPAPIVVERAMYSDALGMTWAAGTSALATRLP